MYLLRAFRVLSKEKKGCPKRLHETALKFEMISVIRG
jgi:hypothetical protein